MRQTERQEQLNARMNYFPFEKDLPHKTYQQKKGLLDSNDFTE